jgi:hypothetical protein
VLAGFAITLVALVAASRDAFVASDVVLSLAVLAAGALTFAMQLGMYGAQYDVAPSDYLAWHPMAAVDDGVLAAIRSRQAWERAMWRSYVAGARRTYHVGITALLLGVGAAVLPADMPRLLPQIAIGSYVPAVVAVGFALAEILWIFAPSDRWPGRLLKPGARLGPPPPLPSGFRREALS